MLPQFSKDKTVNFAHLLTRRFCTPARGVRQTRFSLARMARSEQGALKRTVSEGCSKGAVCVRKGWVAPQTEWGGRQPRVGGNHGLGRQPRRRRRRRAKSPAGTCVFCAETCRRSCVSA